MTITFVLGNGFDIQLGLLTKYSDFLQEYTTPPWSGSDNIIKFKEYLSRKDIQELWSDAEIAMGKHLGQFSDATVQLYNERVRDFERNMIKYLKQQQEKCCYSDKTRIATRFKEFLSKSFDEILTNRRDEINSLLNVSRIYNFITFNYTDLLEQIKKCCNLDYSSDKIQTRISGSKTYTDFWDSIIHVHGTLNKQIIMGVNDESQLDLQGNVTLTESLALKLIKPTLNQESKHNFDLPAKEIISRSDMIAIYGVSYGDTDKLWWEEIVNWLKKRPENKLVAFVRDQANPFVPELPWDELDYEKNKRIEILKKLHINENDSDFNTLIDQIYIILNTTKLNLKEILLPPLENKTTADSTNSQELVTV